MMATRTKSVLSLLEDQLHCLGVKRLHGGEFQAFHHVKRALLILLEMLGLEVRLVSSIRGIDFENTYLR